jgi:hypothetical protein
VRWHRFDRSVATAFVSALPGCGGGGGGAAPVTPSLAPQTGQGVPASIVIRIPSATQTSSGAARRPRYVSTASFSTKIAITGAQSCTKCSSPVTLEVSLAGFPGPCVTSGSGKTCTIPLNLLTGSYVGTIRIYDGVLDGQGHVTGEPIAVCSLTLNISFLEIAAIADFQHVAVWPIGGTAPLVTLTTGISTPSAVAFGFDGTLFVGNTGNDTVTAYAPPYTAPPTVISIGIHKPVALAVDAANNLIVANALGSTTLYPPPYKTATPLVFLDGGTPVDVRVDGIDNLWTLNQLVSSWIQAAVHAERPGLRHQRSVLQQAGGSRSRLQRPAVRRGRRKIPGDAVRSPALERQHARTDDLLNGQRSRSISRTRSPSRPTAPSSFRTSGMRASSTSTNVSPPFQSHRFPRAERDRDLPLSA